MYTGTTGGAHEGKECPTPNRCNCPMKYLAGSSGFINLNMEGAVTIAK